MTVPRGETNLIHLFSRFPGSMGIPDFSEQIGR